MGWVDALLVVVLALAVGAIFIGPFSSIVTSTTESKHVTNESLTADPGTWQDLDENSLVGGSETVFAENTTSGDFETAEKDTDYEFNYSHGRIKPLNSSTVIQDGDELKVTYDWKRARGQTAQVIGLLPLFVAVFMVLIIGGQIGKMT